MYLIMLSLIDCLASIVFWRGASRYFPKAPLLPIGICRPRVAAALAPSPTCAMLFSTAIRSQAAHL